MEGFSVKKNEEAPAILTLFSADNKEILKFEQNGDILVHGNLIKNDTEVVEGFRIFLRGQGLL